MSITMANEIRKMSLYDMRKESGLGTTEIAHHVGVSYPTLLNWEKGNSIPDALSLRKLLKLYNKTNDDLDWKELEKQQKIRK